MHPDRPILRSTRPLLVLLGLGCGLALAPPATAAAAKTARTPVALPDWSGVWNPAERNIFDPEALPPPKAGEIAGYMPDTSYSREYPPYHPDYEARYEATLAKTRAGIATDPTGRCLPPGFPRVMTTPMPLEFIVQPNRVVILFEAWSQTRRIWTDGRPHPDELDPTYNGHSIGHWEGDTLVVDTVGMRADTVFDVTGAPHSDAMHVTERLRRLGPDKFENRITVEDPKAFTKPWTVVRTYTREPDWEIREYVCEENQQDAPQPNAGAKAGASEAAKP